MDSLYTKIELDQASCSPAALEQFRNDHAAEAAAELAARTAEDTDIDEFTEAVVTDINVKRPKPINRIFVVKGIGLLTTKSDFFKYGECKGLDPDMFLISKGDSADEAKAVCAGCLVREVCLEYALENPMSKGVLGGTTNAERARIRRKRKAAKLEQATA